MFYLILTSTKKNWNPFSHCFWTQALSYFLWGGVIIQQCFLYLDLDPEPWTQPLQHCRNKEYYLHLFLIEFWSFVLYLDMDPEPSTQALQGHGNRKYHSYFLGIFSNFLAIFQLVSIFRYWPWTLNTASMATVSSTVFPWFFLNFPMIFLHFICVFLFKIKSSHSVERWINQSVNEKFAYILSW